MLSASAIIPVCPLTLQHFALVVAKPAQQLPLSAQNKFQFKAKEKKSDVTLTTILTW